MIQCRIRGVLFDFGGVLSEEGFKNGLKHIARINALDPGQFFETARELIYSTGYLTGHKSEAVFWDQLRMRTGIQGTDQELKEIILEHFLIRDWMMALVRMLKEHSVRLAILSDQTNWLDELDQRCHFSNLFEEVFNSYHLGKSKNDPSQFIDVLSFMRLNSQQVLFVDDTRENIERAHALGLNTIHYTGKEQFLEDMQRFFPWIRLPG